MFAKLRKRLGLIGDHWSALSQRQSLESYIELHRGAIWFAIGFGTYLTWLMMSLTPSVYYGSMQTLLNAANDAEFEGRVLSVIPLLAVTLISMRMRNKVGIATKIVILATGTTVFAECVAAIILAADGQVEWVHAFLVIANASAMLFVVVWGEAICRLNDLDASVALCVAYIISFLLTFLFSLVSPIGALCVHVTLLIISMLMYLRTKHASVYPKESSSHSAIPQNSAIKMFIGVGAFGIIMGFLFRSSEAKTATPNESLWLIGGLCVCIVLLAVMGIGKNAFSIKSMAKLVLPLFAIGEFLVFAFAFDQDSIEVFAMGCAWIYFRLFYFLAWRWVCVGSSTNPLTVFSSGQAIMAVSGLGGLLYNMVARAWLSEFASLAVMCIAMILVSQLCFVSSPVQEPEKHPAVFDPEDEALCEMCADMATLDWKLSRQERTIALLLARGKDNEDIQGELFITRNTLRTHLRNIYKKADAHSREELVIKIRAYISRM